MNQHLVIGLFAFYVMVVSLYRILSGESDDRLAFVRKTWGRIRGLSIYFCVHVVLPLLVGIIFFGWGVVNFRVPGSTVTHQGVFEMIPEIRWELIRDPADQKPKPELTIPLCA